MMKGQTVVINTRIHDNRKRGNRRNKAHMHGYYSNLDVLNTLIECGADRDAVNRNIIDAITDGAGNAVAYENVTFVYQGEGCWLRPMIQG